ncbi:hypothetical protein FB639_004397, partial [Coemansia asiatica]
MRRVLDAIAIGVVALGLAHAAPESAGPDVDRIPLPPGHITSLSCAQDGHRVCVKDKQRLILVCNNGKYVAAHCPTTMACTSDGSTAHCTASDTKADDSTAGPQGNKRTAKYVIEAGPALSDKAVALLGHKIVIRHHHKPKLVLHYDAGLPHPTPEPEPPRPEVYHGDPPPVYYDGNSPECNDYSCGGGPKPVVYPEAYPAIPPPSPDYYHNEEYTALPPPPPPPVPSYSADV